MEYWNFGDFADQSYEIACFAASVRASSTREAIASLREELRRMPMSLYIGPTQSSTASPSAPVASDTYGTTNGDVVLFKLRGSDPT